MMVFSRAAVAVLASSVLVSFAGHSALAQPPGRQTDGNVDRIVDNVVYLHNGASFPINDATRVTRIRYGGVSDLEPGKNVSISARPGAGGALEAALIGVFAEGVTPNEGQREMPQVRFCEPGCTVGDLMTNAAINEARLDAVSGGEIAITFAGQSGIVMIGRDTRVEVQSAGSIGDVVQGANVLGFLNDEGNASGVWVYLD